MNLTQRALFQMVSLRACNPLSFVAGGHLQWRIIAFEKIS
jgi:hypothetical protein